MTLRSLLQFMHKTFASHFRHRKAAGNQRLPWRVHSEGGQTQHLGSEQGLLSAQSCCRWTAIAQTQRVDFTDLF